MTNPTLTLIAALLDRTGSMESCKDATEDGFDEYINGQKTQPGKALVTLAQFDAHPGAPVPEFCYTNTPIADVPKLVLDPRGRTPLLDATGEFVTQIGQDLEALPEDRRPGLVICVIMTDGKENASHKWSWEQVHDLITQQREVYNWHFIFLGANIDAVAVGADMGIPMATAMTFNAHDDQAVMDSYAPPGIYTSAVRSASLTGQSVAVAAAGAAFTEEDRAKAMGEKKAGSTP